MKLLEAIKNIVFAIRSFFPIQLIITNFRKNQILLLYWFILFSSITNDFGKAVGIPYLFLDPEYMGSVNIKGMLIMGVTFGIFVISFFITSYILDSHRFVFLGTIKYPFMTFCLNNALFPILFTIIYLCEYYTFQINLGLHRSKDIFLEELAFLLGSMSVLAVFFWYFRKTNKDTIKYLVEAIGTSLKKKRINAVRVMKNLKQARLHQYSTNTYINIAYRIKKVNHDIQFDKAELLKIIDQHHLNAVSVELVIFATIIIIGYFRDIPEFQIPAAASAFLLFSFFAMFTGAFSYWLRGWAITGIIALAIVVNILFERKIISVEHQAFGLNYKTEAIEYNLKTLSSISSKEFYTQDSLETIAILEKWKAKFPNNRKPKMVLMCTSGGGLRAATWTTTTLSHVNNDLNNKLMEKTVLITGASGGMIGANYYRDVYNLSKQNNSPLAKPDYYIDNIAKDVLNPMIFSMVVSDFFIGIDKYKSRNQEYYKGRGYAFERKIDENTEGVMNKLLIEYKQAEQNADIPLMFLTPSILNDGRKLYISPQNISYMSHSEHVSSTQNSKIKGIEFRRMFANQNADSLQFISALRMSATFPYVTPNVELPSIPKMEVMDAGYVDNFGVSDAVRFAYVFRDWINENTSGVALISIRDSEKEAPIKSHTQQSFFGKFFNPIKSLYANWDAVHDLSNDNATEYAMQFITTPFEVFSFQYIPKAEISVVMKEMTVVPAHLENEYDNAKASLSWHLTEKEKEGIKKAIHNKNNTQTINRLKDFLKIE